MTYWTAKTILDLQDRNLRKMRDVRIFRDGYEYRVSYWGGFAAYIAIDRRKVGKRNFRFFSGISADHCMSVESAMEHVNEEIDKKTGKGAA